MLADGLYERFGQPDFALALHDWDDLPAGKIGMTSGFTMAQSTQMDIVVRGVGGHGSKPEKSKDPIVLAAQIVLALQTIVSREISPFDQAVVTVGTIHGGTKRNIIPEEVKLELQYPHVQGGGAAEDPEVGRAHRAGRSDRRRRPGDRMPLVTRQSPDEFAPALYNDPKLAARITPAIRNAT